MVPVPYLQTRHLVRALRLKRGLTQEELAERAKVDYKHYQRFEQVVTNSKRKSKRPTLKMLEALSEALGVKVWLLLCDEPALISKRTGVRDAGRREAPKVGRPRKT